MDTDLRAGPGTQTRRTLLAGAAGGLLAAVAGALGRPVPAAASHLLGFGHSNDAGSANTTLATNSTGTALLVQQNGTGTALRGVANDGIAGFFTSANGSGVSGVVAANNKYGVYGGNDAATLGTGAAIRASGQQNHGLLATSAHASAYAVKGINSAVSGRAILGQAPATTGSSGIGVIGQADGDLGSGVHGLATSATGTPNGVRGVAGAPAGKGVFGQTTAATYGDGAAVRADGQQNHGLVATTANTSANAVRGLHSAVGVGVLGESAGGVGVRGSSTVGTAVFGFTGGASGPGVLGGNNASSGGYGVYGSATATMGQPFGVYGFAYSNGYAGYFAGNAHVTGTLSKAAGSFKIDHPLDPANRYLSHSFVESPDMLNVYNGNVTTDDEGNAVVALPAWFEALNRDFRYQLTAIGEFAQAMVASKVKGNHFTIATDRPNVEVSWLVTGVRRDAYAEAHRIPVEERKPAAERGTYLHPVEHGQAPAKGLDAQRAKPEPLPR